MSRISILLRTVSVGLIGCVSGEKHMHLWCPTRLNLGTSPLHSLHKWHSWSCPWSPCQLPGTQFMSVLLKHNMLCRWLHLQHRRYRSSGTVWKADQPVQDHLRLHGSKQSCHQCWQNSPGSHGHKEDSSKKTPGVSASWGPYCRTHKNWKVAWSQHLWGSEVERTSTQQWTICC